MWAQPGGERRPCCAGLYAMPPPHRSPSARLFSDQHKWPTCCSSALLKVCPYHPILQMTTTTLAAAAAGRCAAAPTPCHLASRTPSTSKSLRRRSECQGQACGRLLPRMAAQLMHLLMPCTHCCRAHTATPHRLPQGHEGAAAGAAGGEEAEEEGGVCGLVGDATCQQASKRAQRQRRPSPCDSWRRPGSGGSGFKHAACVVPAPFFASDSWQQARHCATCNKGGPQRRMKGRAPRSRSRHTGWPAGGPARWASRSRRLDAESPPSPLRPAPSCTDRAMSPQREHMQRPAQRSGGGCPFCMHAGRHRPLAALVSVQVLPQTPFHTPPPWRRPQPRA